MKTHELSIKRQVVQEILREQHKKLNYHPIEAINQIQLIWYTQFTDILIHFYYVLCEKVVYKLRHIIPMEKKEIDQFQINKHKSKLKTFSYNKKEVNGGCLKKLKQYMASTSYTLIISIITIYSIFSIDIDKGFFNQNASLYFSTIHTISMGLFLLEIILNSIIEKDYAFHFYFWIDVFSTLTMLLEIIWIENLMSQINNIQMAISFTKVSKASRLSKIGTKSTKILKLIRLIKLFKFVRKQENIPNQEQILSRTNQIKQTLQHQGLRIEDNVLQNKNLQLEYQINENENGRKSYKIKRLNVNRIKQQQIQMKWELQSEQIHKKKNPNPIQQKPIGTKVGDKLNYQIQKNLVLMVMGLIMVIPLLSADTWFTKISDMQLSTQNYISTFKQDENSTIFNSWIQVFFNLSLASNQPLLFFNMSNDLSTIYESLQNSSDVPNLIDLRQSQKIKISNSDEGIFFQAIFSKKQETQITSWINMGRSMFIILVLVFASFFFIKDLQNYALTPLYKMNSTVQKIDKDPFSVLETNSQQNEFQDLIQEVKEEQEMQLETNILQKFFIKITSLLALGVGETPFKLVSSQQHENQNNSFISEDLNFVKIQGIFVCMQVAHFQEIIENIEERDSSTYINLIMQIFHEIVIQNGGFIFHQDESYSIVCWKTFFYDFNQSQKNIHSKMEQKKKAELVFMTYVKFLEKIALEPKFKKYSYFEQFIENFQFCKIHLGIHPGMAYCGAIGSDFKLTLRVIGQDISIVKSLCKNAKYYKLQNLFTGNFLKLIPFLSIISRKIEDLEFVQNNYRTEPIDVYSIYVNNQFRATTKTETMIPTKEQEIQQESELKERRRIKNLLKTREEVIQSYSKYKTQDLINYCKHFLKKNQNIEEWIQIWKESNDFYEDGQWTAAKSGYQNIKDCSPLLLDFVNNLRIRQISQRDQPPANWKKYKQTRLLY